MQSEPREGEPSTERTEVRIVYDQDTLYLGVSCFDREPSRLIVNDIRKDFDTADSDVFGVVIDGFHDRRNGFIFVTNPRGARFDQQVANEGRDLNPDWDGVWSVAARITRSGWTAEIAIPFKTIRFPSAPEQIWGINFARRIRRRNEIAFWSPVPRRFNLYRTSYAGELQGLRDLSPGRNLKIKPFALAGTTRELGPQEHFRGAHRAGLDVKYGVTPALTLDLTLNTDFSQVEADVQQVNLTRFTLFFPEKREFFLENAGIFQFGEVPRNVRFVGQFRPPEEEILLVFTRRIGLAQNASGQSELVPLRGGARLTGRAGRFTLGIVNLQVDSHTLTDGTRTPATNFTIARVKRDVFANSDVGAIFLNRQNTQQSSNYNRVLGVDGNFRIHDVYTINGFLSRSRTPGSSGHDAAGKIALNYETNFVNLTYSFLDIQDNFQDDVGFVKRRGIKKHFLDWGVRPRPKRFPRLNRWLREFYPHGRYNYFNDQRGRLVTRTGHTSISLLFQDGGDFEFSHNPDFERLDKPFAIRPDFSIPTGDYHFGAWRTRYESNKAAAFSFAGQWETGRFYDGHKTTTGVSMTTRPSFRLSLSINLDRNHVRLPEGTFTTKLVSLRGVYSFTTNMFLNALIQYNSDLRQISSNVRFNIIHHPLSDLFVVYNEQRDSRPIGAFPSGRSLTVKFTQLLNF